MIEIAVNCGNGGDYEYEVERHYWAAWISQNIPRCEYYPNQRSPSQLRRFNIKPHKEADKAIVTFDDPANEVIFLLKKPEYVDHRMIDWKS